MPGHKSALGISRPDGCGATARLRRAEKMRRERQWEGERIARGSIHYAASVLTTS
ncbi:MAG: hypothetical protein QOD37_450 [Gaiellales bacterium]|jgi:hypothetical protein|nr:hypothetical protein [Gaiellales bacterium]